MNEKPNLEESIEYNALLDALAYIEIKYGWHWSTFEIVGLAVYATEIVMVLDIGHKVRIPIDDLAVSHVTQFWNEGVQETPDPPQIELPEDMEPTVVADFQQMGLNAKQEQALYDAGFNDYLALMDASDEELLAVKGIGKSALGAIRVFVN